MIEFGAVEIVAGVLLLLNLLVTLRLLFDGYLTRTQKLLQLMIVWLIPAIGAIGIYLMLRSDSDPRGPREPPFGGGGHDGMPGGIQGP